MKFADFCQKNAVAVALLAAIIALGFSLYNSFCPTAMVNVAESIRVEEPRRSMGERFRMPRHSEEYIAKYKDLVALLTEQVKLDSDGYKSGTIPPGKLLADRRDLALAQVALLRLEENRRNPGAVEALIKVKFAEQIEQQNKQLQTNGKLSLCDYNQSRIALAEAELDAIRSRRFLRKNPEFTKLSAEFTTDKCDLDTLKALVEAEIAPPPPAESPAQP
ncbi:MAG: hypothetical protein LBM70_05145 [Victivallales bacterium]|jgi:hypothetical protein|nr:hypothetical protein [Victivallales bacterium]